MLCKYLGGFKAVITACLTAEKKGCRENILFVIIIAASEELSSAYCCCSTEVLLSYSSWFCSLDS